MKQIFLISLSIALFTFASCKRDAFKEVGNNADFKIDALGGTWSTSSVIQTDEDAIRKGFPFKTQDITSDFNLNQTKITLNLNGVNPGTFTISYGTAAKLLKHTSGNWALDNLQKPTKVYLISGVDSIKLKINNYTDLGQIPSRLGLKLLKSAYGKTQLGYDYSLTK